MCDECFSQVLNHAEFCAKLCDFRQMWSTESFWRKSGAERTKIIDELLTAFASMDGDVQQIESAGLGLRASITEYKLRNGLRLLI